jgi:uncharacterized protein YbaA (DUF1428 family)
MPYVDGFVVSVPLENLAAYRRLARLSAKVWKEHGALEYRECVADDANPSFGIPFSRAAKAKAGETVVFAWIVFKSRAHRDRVNAKAMNDPRLAQTDPKNLPMDCKRMIYGGFKVLVESIN